MEMNKPITLVREEFMGGIARLASESGLPLFIVEDCLRSLLNGVSELARQQLEEDRQAYFKAMAMAQMEKPVEKVDGEIIEE